MWVVGIVLKLLLNLVAEKSYHEKLKFRIQLKILQKAKKNLLYLINLATSSNIINVENNVILLYFIKLFCYERRFIFSYQLKKYFYYKTYNVVS